MIGYQDKMQAKRMEAIEAAATEATRFIEKADAALADLKQKSALYPSKEYAAAKRASMDLSRSLSAMRGVKWG